MDEANFYKAQIEGYRARISLLQHDLVLAQDKIDQIRTLHTQALDEESYARKRLEHQVRNYQVILSQIETERDDLRDSVLELIARVELTNGFNSWPRSQMEVTSYLEPISPQDGIEVKPAYSQSPLSYSAAKINSLIQERDLERQARRFYQAQVHSLQAQIARRDAAIEECVERLPEPRQISGSGEPKDPLSPEELVGLLRKTVENNQVLEQEVRALTQKLQRARLSAPDSDIIGRTASTPSAGKWLPLLQSQLVATQGTTRSSPRGDNFASDPSVYVGPANIGPDLANTSGEATPEPPEPPHLIQELDNLDRQIDGLSSKISAFQAERSVLWRIVTSKHPDLELDHFPSSSQHIFVERAPEYEAPIPEREIFNQMPRQRLAQNSDDRSIESSSITVPEVTTVPSLEEQEPFDGDGELSMELATPLFPVNTIMSPQTMPHSPPQATQSPGGSKQSSPRMIRPRILPSYFTSDSGSPVRSPSPRVIASPHSIVMPEITEDAEENLLRVERELASAQRHLEEGNQQIAHLQTVLQEIQAGKLS